jgi:hypothetical protein
MTNYRPRNLRIYSYTTNRTIFHVEDLLDIGKLALDLWSYQKGKGAIAHHTCYLSAADARLVAHRLTTLLTPNPPSPTGSEPFKFTDYKGAPNGNGEIIARVLTIEWAVTDRGNDGLRIVAASGPGQLTPTRAVMPAGKLASVVAFLPPDEALKMALAIRDHLLAWAAASYFARRANLWSPQK